MRTLILLIFGVAALTAYGQGTIRFVNLGGIQFPSEEAGSIDSEYGRDTPMDFDGDGTTDLIVRTWENLQYLVPSLTTEIASVRNPPPDSTSFAVPLRQGAFIGSSLNVSLQWAGVEDGGPMGPIGPFLSACYDIGCSGLFVGETAYLGFQFDVDGQTHYGWMHLWSRAFLSEVYGYAYNTVPNQPILAGQVPEPGTWAMLVGGGLMLYALKARRWLK